MVTTDAMGRWERTMRMDGASSTTIRLRVRIVLNCARHAQGVSTRVPPRDRAAALHLTREDVEEFLLRLTRGGQPLAQNTRASYYQHINLWLQFCADEDYLPVNPLARRRRRPPARKGRPRPLSDAEVSRMLRTAEPTVVLPAELLPIRMGLRAAEVCRVRGEDFQNGMLGVLGKGTGGGKYREIPIHPDIEVLRQRMPRIGWWFPSPLDPSRPRSVDALRGRVTEHMRLCGIRHGSWHRGRHTYATELREQGVDIRVIQELLGHESLATTQIYTQVSRRQLVAAVHELPGLSRAAGL